MSELISKDGAVEAVCKLCVDGQTAKVDGYFIPIRDALENVLKALPSVETTAQYDDFHEEINRLTKELEYYHDRYEAVKRINDSQVETIRTYAAIVNILEKELKEIKEA